MMMMMMMMMELPAMESFLLLAAVWHRKCTLVAFPLFFLGRIPGKISADPLGLGFAQPRCARERSVCPKQVKEERDIRVSAEPASDRLWSSRCRGVVDRPTIDAIAAPGQRRARASIHSVAPRSAFTFSWVVPGITVQAPGDLRLRPLPTTSLLLPRWHTAGAHRPGPCRHEQTLAIPKRGGNE